MKHFGKYLIFLSALLRNRVSFKTNMQQTLEECIAIGINTVFIVVLVSLFMGAVTSIQTAYYLKSTLLPKLMIGCSVRNMTLSELSPTVIGVIFAGKVGSSIAGQLGSMRISEQIDALEIMGINAISFLVLPKIVAAVFVYPLLVIISAFLSILGGYVASTWILSIDPSLYVQGIRMLFDVHVVYVAIYKSLVFAFLVASIASYKGFYAFGGAVGVGKASTSAVTQSCIAILTADCLLTQLFL